MRHLLLTTLALATLLLAGCGDFGQVRADGDFPAIVDLIVEPDVLSEEEANEGIDFTVEMVLLDFQGGIEDADAFIQLGSDQRQASPQDFEIDGNTVRLIDVNRTWFQGLDPGEYQIGASVLSDAGEDVTELDLATVTVSE